MVRQSLVSRLSHRSLIEKAEAYIWALERNIPLYYYDGLNISELMCLRNGRPIYYITNNANSAAAICTDKAHQIYGLKGTKQTIGIWDGGAVCNNHIEFGGRVILFDNIPSAFHATGVAGTIGAAGIESLAMGMASEAYIDSYDWNEDIAEIASRAASFPGEPDKIYVSNHSYGIAAGWTREYDGYYWWGEWNGKDSSEELFGQYGETDSQFDYIAYKAPYCLMFKAAGNDRSDNPCFGETVYYRDKVLNTLKSTIYSKETCPLGDGEFNGGYGTISTFGNAKNIITVGAVENITHMGTHNVEAKMTSFSSWGPTDDGRIKPDIVANGSDLYTTYSNTAFGYGTVSGTSFSCPSASGSALLLTELYSKLFPEEETGKLCQGIAMRASTLKGLIIHTADDLGRPGPDYCYGWGLMNTEAAADLINSHHKESSGSMLAEMVLSDEDPEDEYYFYSTGNEIIRITLSWTDPNADSTYQHNKKAPCLTYTVIVSYKGALLNQEQDYSMISTNALYNESGI